MAKDKVIALTATGERGASTMSGYAMLVVLLLAILADAYSIVSLPHGPGGTSNVVTIVLATIIGFVAVVLALGVARGVGVSLASALVYPTLQLFGFSPAATYTGFFGWANLLRYVGAFALVLLLPRDDELA